MKEWIISIGVVILFTVIAIYIIPDGKLGKYIKGIFSVLIIFVIIKPIFNVDIDKFIYQFEENKTVNIQNNYIDYIYKKRTENYKVQIVKSIEDIGVFGSIVKIDYEITNTFDYRVKNVSINLVNSVIKSDKEHIVIIEEIKEIISNLLLISIESISVKV